MSDNNNLFFHYIIPEYFPENGGIQKSLRRISNSIEKSFQNSEKNIYVLETEAENESNIFYLINDRLGITKPIQSDSNPNRRNKNIQRVNFLVLHNKIKSYVKSDPDKKHMIISFYASHAGFYAQLVASALHLPHIASVRGSDFYVNFLNHTSYGSLEFVVNRANYIVTTNNFQNNLLTQLYPNIQNKITTIHNAIEESVLKRKRQLILKKNISLVADCGFSYKKGTEFIVNGFETLIKKGYNVELKIAGEIDGKTKEFWKKLIVRLNKKYKKRFEYLGFINNIQEFLDNGDIYLSASLSEGCSNSRILALCTGIPIVTTENGAISDYKIDKKNIYFTPSGDQIKFTNAIIKLIHEIIESKDNVVSESELRSRIEYFSLEREKKEWNIVIQKILDNEN